MVDAKRKFTIQGSDLGFEGGRYKGTDPILAARKAAKQLFRMIENKKKNPEWHKYEQFAKHKVLKFIIREVTRGSKKDTYFYEAVVIPLPEPKVIKRDGVEITVTKMVKVKTCEEHMKTVGHTAKTS
jgi:oxalate decarboxylase/phosphoglucose isomerase-like protein (cupin superfamily)